MAWYLRERSSSATASAWMMASLDLARAPSVEVVVAGDPGSPDTLALLQAATSRNHPGITVLLRRTGGDPLPEELAPFTRGFAPEPGKEAAA